MAEAETSGCLQARSCRVRQRQRLQTWCRKVGVGWKVGDVIELLVGSTGPDWDAALGGGGKRSGEETHLALQVERLLCPPEGCVPHRQENTPALCVFHNSRLHSSPQAHQGLWGKTTASEMAVQIKARQRETGFGPWPCFKFRGGHSFGHPKAAWEREVGAHLATEQPLPPCIRRRPRLCQHDAMQAGGGMAQRCRPVQCGGRCLGTRAWA